MKCSRTGFQLFSMFKARETAETQELTTQQLRHLRPFFDQVAEVRLIVAVPGRSVESSWFSQRNQVQELKMHEVQLFSDSAGGRK